MKKSLLLKLLLAVIMPYLLVVTAAPAQESPPFLPEFQILTQGGSLTIEQSVSDVSPKDFYSLAVVTIGNGNVKVTVEKTESVPGEWLGLAGAAISLNGKAEPLFGLLETSTKFSRSASIGTKSEPFGVLLLYVALLKKSEVSVPPYNFSIDLVF